MSHEVGVEPGPAPTARRRRLWPWALVGLVVGVPLAARWALTPKLEPTSGEAHALPKPDEAEVEEAEERVDAIDWPAEKLEGLPAKRLLLKTLEAVRERHEASEGYTAVMRRRERIGGKLGEEQTLEMKVRHRPFAVYLKFVRPEAGKEVVYAEDKYDGHVMAHPVGAARLLLPRLKVPPTHALALAGNRHPITEAGLLNLTSRLIGFRHLDLNDPDAVTILDRATDGQGRPCLRSLHTHPHQKPERPFARIEVLYDPETKIPLRITSHDWPEPGDDGPLQLAEQYDYSDLVLDAPLTDLDFNPANPAYDFGVKK